MRMGEKMKRERGRKARERVGERERETGRERERERESERGGLVSLFPLSHPLSPHPFIFSIPPLLPYSLFLLSVYSHLALLFLSPSLFHPCLSLTPSVSSPLFLPLIVPLPSQPPFLALLFFNFNVYCI